MKFSEYQARIAAGEDGDPTAMSVPKEARAIQGMRAGIITRVCAVAIDIGAVIVTVLILNGILAIVRVVLQQTVSVTVPEIAMSVALGAWLLWLFWTIGWWSTGRTLGMHIMGLRVINHAGDNLRFPVSAVRSVFCIVFPIGLLWTLVSHENRSLQDIVLRTSVINDWVIGLPTLSHLRKAQTP